jgi:protein-S-isoprenylcysteine O-methyltransferase Ste14
MSKFRWNYIPIPEAHVILLILGVALHTALPLPLFEAAGLTQILGWPLLVFGSLLTVWAVVTVKDIDISRPTRIMDTGPYRFSRNPMYVAWTAIYVGIALLVNTGWLLIVLPVLLGFTHYVVIRREEHYLERRFGKEYRQYRDRVRRYL